MIANKKLLLIAIIIGIITVFALNHYLSGVQANVPGTATAAQQRISVVVAQATIPQHTRITAEMLGMEDIAEDAVHPEALRNIAAAVGGISRSDIIRGEQVLGNRVATEDIRASLSYRVPEGMRAISIPVSEVPGVSGYISPNDKVDILVAFHIFAAADDEDEEEYENTLTVYTTIQNALVLATGDFTKEVDDEERRLVNSVLVAVTPAQAEVLAFAYLQGSFHLTLRSPLDEDVVELDHYNAENFATFRER